MTQPSAHNFLILGQTNYLRIPYARILFILPLIPVSIKSYAWIICNKLFCFECIYLEFRHQSAYYFRTKYRNTSSGIFSEIAWRDLSIEILKSWFGSEVAKIEENGLQVYDVYGFFRIYTYIVYIYGVYRTLRPYTGYIGGLLSQRTAIHMWLD